MSVLEADGRQAILGEPPSADVHCELLDEWHRLLSWIIVLRTRNDGDDTLTLAKDCLSECACKS